MIWNKINWYEYHDTTPNIFYILRVGKLVDDPLIDWIKKNCSAEYLYSCNPFSKDEILFGFHNILATNLLSNLACDGCLDTNNETVK